MTTMFNFFSITNFLTAGIVLFNISCKSNSNKNYSTHTTNDSNVSIVISDKQINDTVPSKMKEISLKMVRNIEVLSINKEIKGDSVEEDYSKCKSWSLTAKQIEIIIKKCESMTSEKQYLSYSFYQCRISGEIKIDDIKYKYWLGAGATLTLKNNDTTLYFGCLGKKCNEYFISGKLTKKELSN